MFHALVLRTLISSLSSTTRKVTYVSGAVEGDLDGVVLRRLVTDLGGTPGAIHVKHGKERVLAKLDGYNAAAEHSPWIVLVDLDDEECPPVLIQRAMVAPAEYMCLRIAVREVEAWLLADPEGLSRFISVARSRLPVSPDSELDPKATLVELARKSRKRDIREDLVPTPGGGRKEGPAYTSRLSEFVLIDWDIDQAADRSESLYRARTAIAELLRRA